MSLLSRCEILRVFVNQLTVDDMYSRHYRECFAQPIQKELSKKQMFFSQNFIAFLKPIKIFKHFLKKNEYHSLSICSVIDSKRRGYLNV